jgi:hypothetical protein
MPHTQAFFPLFERHAATVTAAAEALGRMLEGGEALSQQCRASSARGGGGRDHPRGADRRAHHLHHAVRPRRHHRG